MMNWIDKLVLIAAALNFIMSQVFAWKNDYSKACYFGAMAIMFTLVTKV